MCDHKDFSSHVEVIRMADTGQFMAEVHIRCSKCEVPFYFLGLEMGLNLYGATTDPDGTEARLAIAPGPKPILPFGKLTFTV